VINDRPDAAFCLICDAGDAMLVDRRWFSPDESFFWAKVNCAIGSLGAAATLMHDENAGQANLSQEQSGQFAYDAFLSYATDPDYQLARDVERFLESFHLLRTNGEVKLRALQICRDGSDFPLPSNTSRDGHGAVDANLLDTIERELVKSRYLLVICSKNALRSRFMEFEADWFLKNRPGNILLSISEGHDPGADLASFVPERLIQAEIGQKIWYDFRGFREKEARHYKKLRSYDDERVQLAAHLNGATLGTVRPLFITAREHEQRGKRRTAYTVAPVFCFLAGLAAVFAWQRGIARDLANTQRLQALGRASAVQALRAADESNDDVAALLARQAYIFQTRSGDQLSAVADDSLRRILANPHFSHLLLWDRLQPLSATFTADFNSAILGEPDGRINFVNPDHPEHVRCINCPSLVEARQISSSADGKIVAAAAFSDLFIWDLGNRQFVHLTQRSHVTDLIQTRDGTALFSLENHSVWMIQKPWHKATLLMSASSDITALAVDAGRRLAIAERSGPIHLFDLQKMEHVAGRRPGKRGGVCTRFRRIEGSIVRPLGSARTILS